MRVALLKPCSLPAHLLKRAGAVVCRAVEEEEGRGGSEQDQNRYAAMDPPTAPPAPGTKKPIVPLAYTPVAYRGIYLYREDEPFPPYPREANILGNKYSHSLHRFNLEESRIISFLDLSFLGSLMSSTPPTPHPSQGSCASFLRLPHALSPTHAQTQHHENMG